MEAICKNCGKSFKTYPSRKAKYCSHECSCIGTLNWRKVNCQECGKEIITRPDRIQKYCSIKCQALGRTTKVKLICINCGKEFYRKHCEINQKHCSTNCVNEDRRKRRILKVCAVCGKEYKVASDFKHCRNISYCSKECWRIGIHKPSYKKICPICQKEYKVYERDKNSIYCSRECKHIDKTVIKYCPVCNEKIEIRKSHAPKSVYCNKECMRIAYREIYMNTGYIKLDNNHQEIVEALIRFGATVISMAGVKHGVPDILVGWGGKNYLMEIKNKDTRGKLSKSQIKWHREWRGSACVVSTIEEALQILCDAVEDE